MPGPARAGAMLYVVNLAEASAFYRDVLGMQLLHDAPTHHVIENADLQLVLHAIPPAIAAGIPLSRPPEPREEAALKFFFTVPSFAAAEETILRLGGGRVPGEWPGPGFRIRHFFDPEGNIFQLREQETTP
jgi:catechol 2,3-dioxygenase-like lactoylglutathione lyase family enzyme